MLVERRRFDGLCRRMRAGGGWRAEVAGEEEEGKSGEEGRLAVTIWVSSADDSSFGRGLIAGGLARREDEE